jgi:DNA-binding beta-propeller fold protein YncE
MGVGYDSGTGELFVANFDSNTVTVISDGTG